MMMKLCTAFAALVFPFAAHAAAPAAACFSGAFAPFLVAFANQESVQRTHTRVPLVSETVVDADPEPKPVIKKLAKNQVVFPVFPLKAERASTPLTMEITSLTATSASVKLEKPDTDYLLTYYFRKSACWQLVRKNDASL